MTGNFGFFNILTATLILSHAHHTASVFDALSESQHGSWLHLITTAAALLYVGPAIVASLPLNSWVNLAWTHWPGCRLLRPSLLFDTLSTYLRALAQLRIVAAYGVFPPNAFPGQRWVVQYEVGLADAASVQLQQKPHERNPIVRLHWLPVRTRFFDSARVFVAPYHPRVDHGLFYESMGLTSYTPAGALGHHSPYKGAGLASSEWTRLLLRIASSHLPGALRRGAYTLALLASAPEADHSRAVLEQALAGATLLGAPFWRRRDLPRDDLKVAAVSRRCIPLPHPDFAGFEYVAPIVQARALLKLQLPASATVMSETVAGVHLPAVAALHLLRRTAASAATEPRWALAQDEAFLALEAGAIASPADFGADAVYWRRAARSVAPPPAEDVELAWAVVAAAVAEALRRSASCGGSSTASTPAPVAGSVAEIVMRTRTLVDTPAATLAAAAESAALAGATGPIDATAAAALFSFAQLPAVAVALRAAFSPLELRRAEAALAVLALPLLEALEDAAWRPPPTPAVLARVSARALARLIIPHVHLCPCAGAYGGGN